MTGPFGSQLVEFPRHLEEHASRRSDIRRADSLQRLRHGLFDRPRRAPRIRKGTCFEPQPRSPVVTGIPFPLEQAPRDQPLQNSGNGARVESDDMRERSRRQSRKLPNDPQDEPLRSSDAQFSLHPLGHPLQAMLDGPEEPQEIQNRVERVRGVGRRIS